MTQVALGEGALFAASSAAPMPDTISPVSIQILIVLITALGTLAVTLVVQFAANRQQREAVRRQVIAMMQTCMNTTHNMSRQKSHKLHDGNVRPVRMLAERLSEKDVASAFKLTQLDSIFSLNTICWHFLEAVEEYNEYMTPGNKVTNSGIENRLTTALGMAYMLYEKLHNTLHDIGIVPPALKPMPETLVMRSKEWKEGVPEHE